MLRRSQFALFAGVFVVAVLVGLGVVRPAERRAGAVMAEAAQEQPKDDKKYPRGRKALTPEKLKALHDAAIARHNSRVKHFRNVTVAQFDCATTFGNVTPIKNQGNCGSCYVFSGDGVCEMALVKAGYGKADGSFGLSEQYFLDCQNLGGCGGGDEAEVIDYIKTHGAPTAQDYGAYSASERRCQFKDGTKRWQIKDWGYCTPTQQQGLASVQDIKNCMVQFGPISVALDARGLDGYSGGVLSGTGRNIDHAVILVGWDDSKGRAGAWKMRNSWGTNWGLGGYCWIEYGAYSIGTEAIWVSCDQLPPPPPPPPPGPGPAPAPPGSTMTFTLQGSGTFLDGVPYELAPAGTQEAVLKLFALQFPQKAAAPPAKIIDVNDERLRQLEATVERLEKQLGGKKP